MMSKRPSKFRALSAPALNPAYPGLLTQAAGASRFFDGKEGRGLSAVRSSTSLFHAWEEEALAEGGLSSQMLAGNDKPLLV